MQARRELRQELTDKSCFTKSYLALNVCLLHTRHFFKHFRHIGHGILSQSEENHIWNNELRATDEKTDPLRIKSLAHNHTASKW